MLIKLLRHELRASVRSFVPVYILLIALAIIARISWSFRTDAAELGAVALSGVYTILLVALFVRVLIYVIQRFWSGMLGDRAYLTHTLPVPLWQHIVCKLITAMIWALVSALVAVASVMIFASIGVETMDFRLLLDFGGMNGMVGVEVLLRVLLGMVYAILSIYAAMAIGHLAPKARVAFSFLAYIVIQLVAALIQGAAVSLNVMAQMVFTNPDGSLHLVRGAWIAQNLVTGILTVACFIATLMILKKRLNLN